MTLRCGSLLDREEAEKEAKNWNTGRVVEYL